MIRIYEVKKIMFEEEPVAGLYALEPYFESLRLMLDEDMTGFIEIQRETLKKIRDPVLYKELKKIFDKEGKDFIMFYCF